MPEQLGHRAQRGPLQSIGIVAYLIEDKLVIAIASSVLFDLGESDRIFRTNNDVEVYRKYQREHEREPFEPGIAFSFVRRLLSFSESRDDRFLLIPRDLVRIRVVS